MKSKKIAGICLGAVLAFGSAFGMVGCNNELKKPSNIDDEIFAVYGMYVANAESKNEEPMTYDEWYANLLATAKGEKGDQGEKGDTGAKGDKGDQGEKGDTGAKGDKGDQGEKGDTGEQGIQGEKGEKGDKGDKGEKGDTGEPGANGTNGTDGQRGTKIFTGKVLPNNIQGAMAGDLYINTTNWDIYTFNHYDEGPNQWEKIGNIKGEKGDQGPEGPQGPKGDKGDPGASGEVATPAEQKVNIAQDGEQYISLSGLEVGTHIVIADLETKLTTGRLQVQVEKEGAFPSEIVFSEARSTEAGEGHNIYFGYINVPEGASNAKVFAKGEAVNATISFEDYEIPTLKLGETIEICINAIGTAPENLIKFMIDDKIEAGSYNIKYNHYYTDTPAQPCFYTQTNTSGTRILKADRATACTISADDLGKEAYLYYPSATDVKKVTYPVTLTITK